MNLLNLIKSNNILFKIRQDCLNEYSIIFPEVLNYEHRIFMVGYIKNNDIHLSCRTPSGKYNIFFYDYKKMEKSL